MTRASQPEAVLYEINYLGGPLDGLKGMAFKPYHEMHEECGLYAADPDDPGFLEWVSDNLRRIRLKWTGVKYGQEERKYP